MKKTQQKTRTVTQIVKKEVPWNRIKDIPDLFKPGQVGHASNNTYIDVPKIKTIMSFANEAADAYEEYEVEILDPSTALLMSGVQYKVIRKIDDQPL